MSFYSFIIRLAVCSFLALPVAQAEDLSAARKEQLKQELEYVGQIFASRYAPKEWKEKFLSWNLQTEIDKSKAAIDQAKNLLQARSALMQFLNSTADYHVGYGFISTARSSLPFAVKTVEGKTIVIDIEREKLSETAFPFSAGDEILTMNGQPIAGVHSEIQKALGNNVTATDAALADIYLTFRSGVSNTKVERGPVTFTIKRASDNTVGSVQLTWEYLPEELANGHLARLTKNTSGIPGLKMLSPRTLELNKKGSSYDMGEKDPFLPNFGDRIWETPKSSSFDAYMYQSKKGLIGVVRIPSYIPGMGRVEDYSKAVADFAAIIKHFEKFTSALIIDQNNNPGGSVFYLYTLASMLSDQTLTVPQHRVALTHAEAKEWLGNIKKLTQLKSDKDAVKFFGSEFDGYPVTLSLAHAVLDYARFYVDEFRAGKNISSPYYLYGVDKINPYPEVSYTKPIVILTNELDFSGGDFFPAILQDNKRVTIVGTRTAGAGGYIEELSIPNNFGLSSLYLTGSIAKRVDDNPIENLGVTPDILLPMTLKDFRGGFVDYQTKVKAIVNKLVK